MDSASASSELRLPRRPPRVDKVLPDVLQQPKKGRSLEISKLPARNLSRVGSAARKERQAEGGGPSSSGKGGTLPSMMQNLTSTARASGLRGWGKWLGGSSRRLSPTRDGEDGEGNGSRRRSLSNSVLRRNSTQWRMTTSLDGNSDSFLRRAVEEGGGNDSPAGQRDRFQRKESGAAASAPRSIPTRLLKPTGDSGVLGTPPLRKKKPPSLSSGAWHTNTIVEGDGGDHMEFLKACKIDAEAQTAAWKLAAAKAQETLEYSERGQDASSKSIGSMRSGSTTSVPDSVPEGGCLDAFNGTRLSCTIERYVTRILKYAQCSECNIVVAFLYLERIKRDYPQLDLSPTNLQRLLLVACMIASKFFDDIYYSNKHWAEIGELTLAEVNQLEFIFLGCLDFNCAVQREEYDNFVYGLKRIPRLLSGTSTDLLPLSPMDQRRRQLSVSSQHSGSSSPTARSTRSESTYCGTPTLLSSNQTHVNSPKGAPSEGSFVSESYRFGVRRGSSVSGGAAGGRLPSNDAGGRLPSNDAGGRAPSQCKGEDM
mmetsp:Transcript_13290/g.32013  ORF Transcript_13290/g.32013 Transcript_13290/m.32013 type:complete len:539 (-) Transcript_13290:1100-2716(-)